MVKKTNREYEKKDKNKVTKESIDFGKEALIELKKVVLRLESKEEFESAFLHLLIVPDLCSQLELGVGQDRINNVGKRYKNWISLRSQKYRNISFPSADEIWDLRSLSAHSFLALNSIIYETLNNKIISQLQNNELSFFSNDEIAQIDIFHPIGKERNFHLKVAVPIIFDDISDKSNIIVSYLLYNLYVLLYNELLDAVNLIESEGIRLRGEVPKIYYDRN